MAERASQSSGVLSSLTRAQGVLLFPAEARELREGEDPTAHVSDEAILAADAAVRWHRRSSPVEI